MPKDRLPRPVVKWAGGKSRLVDVLRARMPDRIGTYAEPFCGGAAVFFALAGEPTRRYERAVLSDKNEQLIKCYRAIRDRIDALVRRVKAYQKEYDALPANARREHYYEIRALETERLGEVEAGARLLFLNKTCFNGLWRVNASGQFNVPFGRYATPRIFDEEVLRAAHEAFQGVELRVDDFASVTSKLVRGDFAYFDPPYVPLSRTANFTAYAKDGFRQSDQERLVTLLEELGERGVPALLSNARSRETEKLYARFAQVAVPMARSINSDPKKRGEVDELIVLNQPPTARSRSAMRPAKKKVAS